MADLELLDEIDDLKEKLEAATSALQELSEERDRQVDDYEFKILNIRDEVEEEWKKRLENADREHREKTDGLMAELDRRGTRE